jgi:hypothetical protein
VRAFGYALLWAAFGCGVAGIWLPEARWQWWLTMLLTYFVGSSFADKPRRVKLAKRPVNPPAVRKPEPTPPHYIDPYTLDKTRDDR